MGALTPVGNDVATTWRALVSGESGAANITKFDASTWPVRFACEVKGFDPLQYMERKEAKRADWYAQYAIAASVQAMKQAGLDNGGGGEPDPVGAILLRGIGGLEQLEGKDPPEPGARPGKKSPSFQPRVA